MKSRGVTMAAGNDLNLTAFTINNVIICLLRDNKYIIKFIKSNLKIKSLVLTSLESL
jgi:hypothetical protein